ncbi:carbonic anhydrase [Streptomyces sp. NPDC007808]|uniref:carbonic anhydrase n=1 Tax=Streptomyces sp. NPDC007808 TaxID=3364779 RepID=UPI00369D52C3
MGSVSVPQRRAFLVGGLAASAAVITGCSAKSEAGTPVAKVAAGSAPTPSPAAAGARPDSPRTAFDRLMEGNTRWVDGKPQHPDQTPERRTFVAEEQKPYSAILSCIDSRVPPELVFDTGIGDLFVMRTGGHVVAPVVTGSVEYGPLTAGTSLIVVLGHQRCGAVKAAYKALKDNQPLPGNLQSIVEALRPAYQEVSKQKHADPVDAMIRAHTRQTAADLRRSSNLSPLLRKREVAVVSAYYSLDTGRVEVLGGAPAA